MNTVGKSPGVIIDEVTGPGVIGGVGTSTAAFIGPALQGPVDEPVQITSYDDFLRNFASLQPDGTYLPHIVSELPRRYYLATAVQGFFTNGGSRAYVVRVSTGAATTWEVKNQGGQPVFRLQALDLGTAGDGIKIVVAAASATVTTSNPNGALAATGSATLVSVSPSGLQVTVTSSTLSPGDVVVCGTSNRATIIAIDVANGILTLDTPLLPLPAAGAIIHLAPFALLDTQMRLANTDGLFAGSVVKITGTGTPTGTDQYAVVTSISGSFVTFAASPARTETFDLTAATHLVSQEFQLTITPPSSTAETFTNLSLNPLHPGYVFTAVSSEWVQVVAPLLIPTTSKYPDSLIAPAASLAISVPGADDHPGALGAADYQNGLDALDNLDGVNLVVIPDAAAHPGNHVIQQAMLDHCQSPDHLDRFAILDSLPGAPPSGPGSVSLQRSGLSTPHGYGALYYPWVLVADPLAGRSSTAPPIAVPPSGHVAGVYALTDGLRGVHKAPANAAVQGGVLGLERRLSNADQGPLNDLGIDVLRSFQGSSAVLVWGARTLADPAVTDWRYVSTRRLLIYIEQSLEQGIRWAVFEPNNLSLWGALKRTVSEFLTRVWRDGALFGATADKAFYVRIDEGLNPPALRALGQLNIEIGVAPSFPAEFVIVRIGLWDGGASISET
jgi:phage tail sheath protein FI